jgi:hypothetical protein
MQIMINHKQFIQFNLVTFIFRDSHSGSVKIGTTFVKFDKFTGSLTTEY